MLQVPQETSIFARSKNRRATHGEHVASRVIHLEYNLLTFSRWLGGKVPDGVQYRYDCFRAFRPIIVERTSKGLWTHGPKDPSSQDILHKQSSCPLQRFYTALCHKSQPYIEESTLKSHRRGNQRSQFHRETGGIFSFRRNAHLPRGHSKVSTAFQRRLGGGCTHVNACWSRETMNLASPRCRDRVTCRVSCTVGAAAHQSEKWKRLRVAKTQRSPPRRRNYGKVGCLAFRRAEPAPTKYHQREWGFFSNRDWTPERPRSNRGHAQRRLPLNKRTRAGKTRRKL